MALPIHNLIASPGLSHQMKSYSFREILSSSIMNCCQEQSEGIDVESIYTMAVTVGFCSYYRTIFNFPSQMWILQWLACHHSPATHYSYTLWMTCSLAILLPQVTLANSPMETYLAFKWGWWYHVVMFWLFTCCIPIVFAASRLFICFDQSWLCEFYSSMVFWL